MRDAVRSNANASSRAPLWTYVASPSKSPWSLAPSTAFLSSTKSENGGAAARQTTMTSCSYSASISVMKRRVRFRSRMSRRGISSMNSASNARATAKKSDAPRLSPHNSSNVNHAARDARSARGTATARPTRRRRRVAAAHDDGAAHAAQRKLFVRDARVPARRGRSRRRAAVPLAPRGRAGPGRSRRGRARADAVRLPALAVAPRGAPDAATGSRGRRRRDPREGRADRAGRRV
mmetsp:Transcript_22763/g.70397  ORF Transcript_22763/g.70397 Transcript_22763/m.70397 type:complete len:235 (-) Transcript_22763:180-884(-)